MLILVFNIGNDLASMPLTTSTNGVESNRAHIGLLIDICAFSKIMNTSLQEYIAPDLLRDVCNALASAFRRL